MGKMKIPELNQNPQPVPAFIPKDNGISLNGGQGGFDDDDNLIKRSDRNILYKSNNKIL